jgi:fructose-bisphosphate aldolase class 1
MRRPTPREVSVAGRSPPVPGVAFLSGGQSGKLASARSNAMHVKFKSRLP